MIHLWPHSFEIVRSFSWRLMLMSQQWMNSKVCGRLRHKQDLHLLLHVRWNNFICEQRSGCQEIRRYLVKNVVKWQPFAFPEVSVSMAMSVKPDSVNAHAAFRSYCKIGLDMGHPIGACFHCRYSHDNKTQMQLAARDQNNKKTIAFGQKSETARFTEL